MFISLIATAEMNFNQRKRRTTWKQWTIWAPQFHYLELPKPIQPRGLSHNCLIIIYLAVQILFETDSLNESLYKCYFWNIQESFWKSKRVWISWRRKIKSFLHCRCWMWRTRSLNFSKLVLVRYSRQCPRVSSVTLILIVHTDDSQVWQQTIIVVVESSRTLLII